MDPSDDAARARAERREFIRRNHPDSGGDPERFIAGLAAYSGAATQQRQRTDRPVVRVQRSRRPTRVAAAWLRARLARRPPRRLL